MVWETRRMMWQVVVELCLLRWPGWPVSREQLVFFGDGQRRTLWMLGRRPWSVGAVVLRR